MTGLFWRAALVVVIGALIATHVVANEGPDLIDSQLFRPHLVWTVPVSAADMMVP